MNPVVYRLSETSRFDVQTGRAGLFGFLGHEHLVRATEFSGRIVLPPAGLAAATVEVLVRTDALQVLTEADSSDMREIRQAMREQVLQVDRYPTIRFVSTAVERAGHADELKRLLGLVKAA